MQGFERSRRGIKSRQLLGAAMVALSVGAAGTAMTPAFAQDDTIIVTGSRIARTDLQSSSPVAVVSEQQILFSGEVNVENILAEIPAVAPDLGGTTNNGSPGGIATADLRGLGANRTLVLVNGRRYVASDNQQRVDLNNIPSALIERVEVVTGGASSIYGSDAIAGAVNFILKDDFEGLRIGAQAGRAVENGDGNTANINVTMGANTADGRGNITMFADYTYRDEVLAARRGWSDTAYDDLGGGFVLDPLGSSRIPGSQILGSPTDPFVLPDGSTAQNIGFDENGTPFGSPSSFNFQPDNFITTPQERLLFSTLGRYEINEFVEAYMETTYANNNVNQQLAFDANDIPDGAPLFVPIDGNPLLTNADLVTFLEDNFDTGLNGDTAGDGIATIPDLRRRMVEAGPRFTSFENDALRVLTGLRGDVPLEFGSDWNYDVYYSYARTNRSETLRGFTSDVRIQQAVNATTDAGGNPVCIDQTGGCVPITLFGIDSIDPDAIGFISPSAAVVRETEQQIFNASISGNALELPAGSVGVAFGYEYRDESARDIPDQFVISGELGPGSNEDPVEGQFDVHEVFGEVLIPVLADAPFAESLEIEGAFRYADYSSVGSATAFKAGGSWTPVEGFKIRGLYQEAVRAPNIFELFGQATGAPTVTDGCASAQTAGNQTERDFCAALGVPDPANFTPDSQATTQSTGALLAGDSLDAESAETWTVGFVYDSPIFEGLTVTADYYSIFVDDAIDTLGPTVRVDQCIASNDVNSAECALVSRTVNGDIAFIQDTFLNTGSETRKGIDWQIDYTRDLTILNIPGTVSLFQAGNYTFTNEFVPADGEDAIDCNGIFSGDCTGLGDFNQPKWRLTNNVTYQTGPLQVRAQYRVIGNLTNGAADTIDDLAFEDTDIQGYVDITASYDVNENLNLYAGVENLADTSPPLMGSGFTGRNGGSDAGTDPSLYDVLGRRFFIGAVVQF
ncbi:MAG: TonB-dependent receptor [Pseudomonadota bacterium]